MTQTINMKPPTRAIGAEVEYFYKADGKPEASMLGYISFGDIKDDAEFDSYGMRDNEILYFATRKEFPSLCTRHSGADFIVCEYGWVYR